MLKSASVSLSRQRWLSYKLRRSLLKRLHPGMLKDYPFEVDFFENASGLRFSGNIVNYIDRLVYFCGAHEKYMLSFLRDYARALRAADEAGITYVDVGANAGNHAVFMARQADRVLAFEPFERVRNQLARNLGLNGIHNVQVFDFGLGEKDEALPFYAAQNSNLGAASFQPGHRQDNYLIGNLQIKNGDAVLAGQGGGVHIVKIDVEGHEPFVLRGLKETLFSERPLVVVELTPTTRSHIGNAERFRELFPAGYECYYFASGNPNTGAYRLAPYRYGMTPKIEDVIACPQERLSLLRVV